MNMCKFMGFNCFWMWALMMWSNMTWSSDDHEHHHAMMGLIGDDAITHTAIQDGMWFDQSIWSTGTVPANGAQVLIPAGRTVEYGGLSQASLLAVRVDGVLRFSRSTSSQMVVDTLWVNDEGMLVIGTKNNPIPASVSVAIQFPDNGDIDVNDDPTLMGRGLLARGPVYMHGQRKTTHLKVSVDPVVGDTQLTLQQAPENWSVGDTLIVAGTKYSGWKWDNDIRQVRYHGTQDEVVQITAINGNQITIDQPLVYDHFTPRADLKTSVANMSRNITLSTLDPDNTATHRRGHMMFMSSSPVDVRYVSLWQLGRTDKSFLTLESADFDPLLSDSNVRGRYAFHLHRKGVEAAEPAVAIGNAVFGSPGWGFVHHDSHAIFHNNVSFDTFGAGFVAETGNETGIWTNNLAIKAEGNSAFNPKNGNDRELFDMGRTGDGFWFQGRMVRSVGNIAASVNHGFVYLHRGTGMLPFPGDLFTFPEALTRNGLSGVDDAPILSFKNNESFASTVGLYVVKANPNQQHDVHSHFKNFTAWEVRAGSAMEYTSHYLLENFDIIGKTPEPFSSAAFGVEFGTNTSDMVINQAQIADMPVGVILSKDYTSPTPPEANQYVLIDVEFDAVDDHWVDDDPVLDQFLTAADLNPNQFSIEVNGGIYEYLSPATSAGSGLFWQGVKTDSISATPIPAGTDQIGVPVFDMIAITSEDGYYRTQDGEPYAVVEEFFTERATGTVHKLGLKTRLGPAVDDALGDQFTAWSGAFEVGLIDLISQAPVPNDDQVMATSARHKKVSLFRNDMDPDGDVMLLDGLQQPDHGRVLFSASSETSGEVTYVSDYDYVGTDQFTYWVTDQHGNYSPAVVHIQVLDDLIFANDFIE